MMYITDAYFAKEIMKYMERDRYSIDALEHILEFYDDRGEDVEFDPISICSEWTEYESKEFYDAHKKYIKAGMSDDQILKEVNKHLYAVKLRNDNFLTLEDGSR